MARKDDVFPAVDEDGGYAARLVALRGVHASGIYAIIDTDSGAVLYVGESHTGRLYETITRHFRAWKRDPHRDQWGRRFGGKTYDRRRVSLLIEETDDEEARPRQYEYIQLFAPRDNEVDGVV